MSKSLHRHNGITVRELQEFLKDWKITTKLGEESSVWVGDGAGHSNEAVAVHRLNESDILIDIRERKNVEKKNT